MGLFWVGTAVFTVHIVILKNSRFVCWSLLVGFMCIVVQVQSFVKEAFRIWACWFFESKILDKSWCHFSFCFSNLFSSITMGYYEKKRINFKCVLDRLSSDISGDSELILLFFLGRKAALCFLYIRPRACRRTGKLFT